MSNKGKIIDVMTPEERTAWLEVVKGRCVKRAQKSADGEHSGVLTALALQDLRFREHAHAVLTCASVDSALERASLKLSVAEALAEAYSQGFAQGRAEATEVVREHQSWEEETAVLDLLSIILDSFDQLGEK